MPTTIHQNLDTFGRIQPSEANLLVKHDFDKGKCHKKYDAFGKERNEKKRQKRQKRQEN